MAQTEEDAERTILIPFTLHFGGEIPNAGLDADEVAAVAEGIAKSFQFIFDKSSDKEFFHNLHLREVSAGSAIFKFFLEFSALAQAALPIISSSGITIKDAASIFGQVVKLFEFLKGKPPQSPISVDGAGNVTIINSSGNTFKLTQNITQIAGNAYFQDQLAKSLKPLRRPGRLLNITEAEKEIHSTNSTEYPIITARAFNDNTPIKSNTIEATLKVRQPHLTSDNSWKFSWGRNSITATVTDKNFMQEVLSGNEAFSSGDILRVKLRIEEQQKGRNFTKRHFIDEVISHDKARD